MWIDNSTVTESEPDFKARLVAHGGARQQHVKNWLLLHTGLKPNTYYVPLLSRQAVGLVMDSCARQKPYTSAVQTFMLQQA